MSTELQRRAEALFHEAADQPRWVRAAFLDRRCGNDEPLRSLVERLLRALDDMGDFLEPKTREAGDPSASGRRRRL